jgi:hypothetical protein
MLKKAPPPSKMKICFPVFLFAFQAYLGGPLSRHLGTGVSDCQSAYQPVRGPVLSVPHVREQSVSITSTARPHALSPQPRVTSKVTNGESAK